LASTATEAFEIIFVTHCIDWKLMSRIAYVNGRYQPHGAASVHIEDRGFQFADGVYEVCEVRGGRLVDETRHLARLDRSLGELRMQPPVGRAALTLILREVVARNRVETGLVYVQVTRGAAPRDFPFPGPQTRPSLVVTARATDPAKARANGERGVKVITLPDLRWKRRDIKSVSLLPNVLAKQAAREAGAFEAWLVDDQGLVTEGASSNAWIVTAKGALVTRPANEDILRGITRTTLIDLLRHEGLRLEERAFTVAEALGAREAFLSSATNLALPVVEIDGKPVGPGAPGPIVAALRAKFHEIAEMG
jgi:D-alanine transaminase